MYSTTTDARSAGESTAGRPSLLDTGPIATVASHLEWPPAPPARDETPVDADRRRTIDLRDRKDR